MKRTQIKNAIRTVRTNFVSWLAVSIVVMICCGIYFGTLFYADSMEENLYEYAGSSKMEDFNILASQGLKNEEIDSLKQVPGFGTRRGPGVCRIPV